VRPTFPGMRHKNHDHAIATVARVIAGTTGVAAGLFFLYSIPDLIRYLKLTRM
jgi:hypothetical protein